MNRHIEPKYHDFITKEGLRLDFKNRTVKLDDTDEGIVFNTKPLE